MRYLLIICHDERFTPTESLIAGIRAWIGAMTARGMRVHGNPLRPPGDAVTVRVRDGRVVVANGPFARSKDKMAAYELVECGSIEQAIEAASRHPMAAAGTIEVRPVWAELAE
jgi:hypothetical protein